MFTAIHRTKYFGTHRDRHRWSASVRHGHCPSHRLAWRMVEAARDARLSIPLTQHSNRVSTNASLRRRETRFCGAETKAPKRSQQFNRQIAETKCVHKSPPVRGDSHRTGKSPFAQDCVVGLGGTAPGAKPNNRSNRFEVANHINALLSADAKQAGPFWCVSSTAAYRYIPQTRPAEPFQTAQGYAVKGLRLTDKRARSASRLSGNAILRGRDKCAETTPEVLPIACRDRMR